MRSNVHAAQENVRSLCIDGKTQRRQITVFPSFKQDRNFTDRLLHPSNIKTVSKVRYRSLKAVKTVLNCVSSAIRMVNLNFLLAKMFLKESQLFWTNSAFPLLQLWHLTVLHQRWTYFDTCKLPIMQMHDSEKFAKGSSFSWLYRFRSNKTVRPPHRIQIFFNQFSK